MLFHVREESGIEQFEPRAQAEGTDAVVWAIDGRRLRNYLVPRECPRVTYDGGDMPRGPSRCCSQRRRRRALRT